MNNITKEDIESLLKNLIKEKQEKQDRQFRFITGPQGMFQFEKALKLNVYNDILKVSKHFTDIEKKNINTLLHSELNEDYDLAVEIIKTKHDIITDEL